MAHRDRRVRYWATTTTTTTSTTTSTVAVPRNTVRASSSGAWCTPVVHPEAIIPTWGGEPLRLADFLHAVAYARLDGAA